MPSPLDMPVMAETEAALADPEFHALPLAKRFDILRRMDKGFSGLDPKVQGTIVANAALSLANPVGLGEPKQDAGFLDTLGTDLVRLPENILNMIPVVGDPVGMLQTATAERRALRPKAAEAFNRGSYLESAGYGLASLLPFIGAPAAQAAEEISGGQEGQGLAHLLELLPLPFAKRGGQAIAKSGALDVAKGAAKGALKKTPFIGPVLEGAVEGAKEAWANRPKTYPKGNRGTPGWVEMPELTRTAPEPLVVPSVERPLRQGPKPRSAGEPAAYRTEPAWTANPEPIRTSPPSVEPIVPERAPRVVNPQPRPAGAPGGYRKPALWKGITDVETSGKTAELPKVELPTALPSSRKPGSIANMTEGPLPAPVAAVEKTAAPSAAIPTAGTTPVAASAPVWKETVKTVPAALRHRYRRLEALHGEKGALDAWNKDNQIASFLKSKGYDRTKWVNLPVDQQSALIQEAGKSVGKTYRKLGEEKGRSRAGTDVVVDVGNILHHLHSVK